MIHLAAPTEAQSREFPHHSRGFASRPARLSAGGTWELTDSR
jgi:hypothetical protein